MDDCKLCKIISERKGHKSKCLEPLCNVSYFFSHEDSQSMDILDSVLARTDLRSLRDCFLDGSRVDGYNQISFYLKMGCWNIKPKAQEGYVGDASGGDRHGCTLCSYCEEKCDNAHCVLSHYFNKNNRLDLFLVSRNVGLESVKEKLRVSTYIEGYSWIHKQLKIVEDKRIAAEVDVARWSKTDLSFRSPTAKFARLQILSPDRSIFYSFIPFESSRPYYFLTEDIAYTQHFHFELDTSHFYEFSHVVWNKGVKVSSYTCDVKSHIGSVIRVPISFKAGFYCGRFQLFDIEKTMLLSVEYSFEVEEKKEEKNVIPQEEKDD